MWFKKQTWPALLGVFLLPGIGRGEVKHRSPSTDDATPEGIEFFEKHIRPLLANRCYECHSAASGRSEGGIRLDTHAALIKGGASGPAVIPGDPARSRLITTLAATNTPPFSGQRHLLPALQLAGLTSWVKMGAPAPRAIQPEEEKPKPAPQSHWSFQPITAPPIPATRNQRWPNNDIDRFILSKLEAAGITPTLATDKRALIRRATFDLTGLPPTPEEIDAFLRDRSAGAFAKLVERLLASPRYGERWGRQWLDVARYADSSGDNSDFPIPQARFYRDYVIASFNQDKPYDQFVREQVAGDLLPAGSDAESNEHLIATGFIALSRRFGAGLKETEHLAIEDTLETMGRAVLGLSMSCARCHDHKYDPIPMRDYYALYGIFASTRYPYPGSEPRTYQTNFVPLKPSPEIDPKAQPLREKLDVLDTELDRLDAQITQLEKEGLDTKDLHAAYDKIDKEADGLAADLATFDTAYAVADEQPANARLQKRGEPWNLGEEIPRGFLSILGGRQLPARCEGSGRLELAEWLTNPANPLTARVMVNRIWQHQFGKGLVATPNDFGARGSPPTDSALLDYLAQHFIESSWSVKAVHRLIMLSATYQLSSSERVISESVSNGLSASPALHTEPLNGDSLIARFPRQRLDAEELRDALLFVSGDLDLTPPGPHPFPPAHTWNFSQHIQFNAVYETRHRSVYLMQQRIKKHPFLAVFDGADANASTAERAISTTPLQALFMMNDPFAHAQAEKFAQRICGEAPDDPQRINRAHLVAFGRPARPDDVRDGLAYLEAFRKKLAGTNASAEQCSQQAWSSYARALLGSNEFLFVD